MTEEDDDERPFLFERLGIGYFFLGFAPPFALVNPQGTGGIVLVLVGGAIAGLIVFAAFQALGRKLLSAVAGIEVDATEPGRLAYYSTYLVVAVGTLALLPVAIWIMASISPSGEITGGGGRRSPLLLALLTSAALVSIVAEPIWLRVLKLVSVDPVE